MRVLFVNRYFYPDYAPTGVLLSDLAFALSQQGVHVSVITSRLCYAGGAAKYQPSETVDGVEIHRVWTSKRGHLGLFGRGLDYGSFFLASSWRLWRLARRADVVVAKTDPPLLSVIVAVIAKLRRARTVNWLQDIFPDAAEALNIGDAFGNRLFKLLRPLRNWSLRSARANVVVGETMAAHLVAQRIAPEQIKVISNWANGMRIAPINPAQNGLRAHLGLNDSFVVGYAGNLGRAHELDTIVAAMTLLQDQATRAGLDDTAQRIRFVFVGGGVRYAKLEHEILERRLSNVQILPYQPQERLAETLGVADVHLVSLNPALEGLIVPSKFYGIAAAGRPALFIGAPDGEIARLIDQSGSGFGVSPGDAEALASHILQLADDPELCGVMGARSRSAFEDRWDEKRAVEQWAALLNTASRPETVKT